MNQEEQDRAYDQELEEIEALITKRDEDLGDAGLIVVAAILAGRQDPIYRSYVMKKLEAANGPHPANLMDAFAKRRLRRALLEHADNPIYWLATASGNEWEPDEQPTGEQKP